MRWCRRLFAEAGYGLRSGVVSASKRLGDCEFYGRERGEELWMASVADVVSAFERGAIGARVWDRGLQCSHGRSIFPRICGKRFQLPVIDPGFDGCGGIASLQLLRVLQKQLPRSRTRCRCAFRFLSSPSPPAACPPLYTHQSRDPSHAPA